MAVIGNLVANLVADTSGFTGPMQQAEGTVSRVASSIRSAGSSIVGGMGAAVSTIASVAGGMALVGGAAAAGIGFAVSQTIDANKQLAKLDAVLAATGGQSGITSGEISDLANQLQLLTDFEADATIGAAGVLATFTQVKGDVFKEAIVSAQNLSAVMGQDLQSSVVQIGKALNDPIKGITALSRVGVSFTEQQKAQITQMAKAGNIAGAQAIILGELQTEFGGAAEAMSSPFTRIGNIVGDVVEGIGAVFLPSLEAVATMITTAILPVAEGMGERFSSAGEMLKSVVVPAVQIAMTVIGNLGTRVELFTAQINLAMVKIGNEISYAFTEKLPAVIGWFFDNWKSFWRDFVEFQRAQLRNMLLNIGDNVAMTIAYIKSGGTTEWKFVWTPLTDGFQKTMSDLPKIAERVPTELEKTLGEMATGLEDKLKADMAGTLEAIQAGIDKKPLTPRIKETPKPPETITPVEAKAVGAAQQGTREALSAIFGSMRGEDYQRQLVALQEQQLQMQQKQLDALDAIANDDGIGIED